MPLDFSFTPDFKHMLDSLGITPESLRTGVSKGLTTGWHESKLDLNAPYFKLKRAGVDPGFNILTDPTVQAQIKSKKQGNISPDVQKLFDSILKMREEEANRGASSTTPHQAWWAKALDYISRPGRAVEGFLTRGAEAKLASGPTNFNPFNKANWIPDPGVYKQAVGGAKQGFTKGRFTGGDVAKAYGIEPNNRVGKFLVNLGIDIGTDPLSYVGFGIGKHVIGDSAKVLATKGTAAEISKQLAMGPSIRGISIPTQKVLEKLLSAPTGKQLSPLEKAATVKRGQYEIDKLSTILGGQAAKNAQLSLANDLAKVGIHPTEAKHYAIDWLNPKKLNDPVIAKEREQWFDLLKTSGIDKGKYLDTTLPEIFKETQSAATKQMTEILDANMEQQIKRTVLAKGFGKEMSIAPVPNLVVKAMDKAGKLPVMNSMVKTFNKTFNTGSSFDRQLYITKARAAGKAEQRINLGTQTLVKAFQGVPKDRRIGWMRALTTSAPRNFAHGVLTLADGRDAGDLAQELFDHYGRYIDWTGKGAGIVSLNRLNQYLPHNMRFDTDVIKAIGFQPGEYANNFKNLLGYHAKHFQDIDPQNFFFHVNIGIEKALARDQFMRSLGDLGIPLKATNLNPKDILGASMAKVPIGKKSTNIAIQVANTSKQSSRVAQELVYKHGYEPIYTKSTREVEKEIDPAYARYLKDKIFHPEIKTGLVHLIKMMDDDKHAEGFWRYYDKALSYFKKAVTLPNPGYHIRNSVGDLLTSYTDGVGGIRGLASYAQAAKLMKSINPVSKNEELQNILTAAVTTEGKIKDPLQEIAQLLSSKGTESLSGRNIMKKNPKWKDVPGQYISAEQLMAAYQHSGMKRGFVATDLAHELHGNPNLALKMTHDVTEKILKYSQQREDYFRMAHFIDRIKRSRASTFKEAYEEAAMYVKKFHFDYTDVTPTERLIFARIMPFYKFQRFAAPLMLQMFAASPGKLLNAQKVLNNMAYAQGYTNDGGFLPTADQILPEYMRDAMMLPLFQSGGNSVYFGNSLLPSTSIFSQTLGLESSSPREVAGSMGQNILQNLTPAAQVPFELYFGKRVLGKGQIPVQSKTGSYLPYLFSKTPVSNIGFNKPQQSDFSTALINFLSGLGLSENTPARQTSELYREKDVITSHRKQSGFSKKKPSTYQTPPFYKPAGG